MAKHVGDLCGDGGETDWASAVRSPLVRTTHLVESRAPGWTKDGHLTALGEQAEETVAGRRGLRWEERVG